MEWLNEYSGILIVVFSVIIIILVILSTLLLFNLRNKIAVQRLKFLGSYSMNKETGEPYAGLTIGNRSLNDLGLSELGIQNGKIKFPLTELFRQTKHLTDDALIVVEQRSAISFDIASNELRKLVIDVHGKKVIKSLRIYAIDLTGTLYRKKIPAVKKLLSEILKEEKRAAR